jgi:hypothetical protein
MTRDRDDSWSASTVLATGLDHPGGIAVDATHAYFTTGGFTGGDNAIRRIPLDGGESELVARIEGAIPSGHLALGDDRVYWTSYFGCLVAEAPKTGGPILVLAEGACGYEIAVAHGFAYWIDGAVHRCPLACPGDVQCLAATRPSAGELLVENQWAWWREDSGLWRCALGAGTPPPPELVLPREAAGTVEVIAGSGDVLFCGLAPSGHSRLVAVPTQTPGDASTFIDLAPGINGTAQLGVDRRHVYFFARAGTFDDALCRVPQSGGPVERLDGEGHSSGRMAIGPRGVYWTDIDSVRLTPCAPAL